MLLNSPLPETDLDRVKNLILGDDYRELLALREVIADDQKFAAHVAGVIAEALKQRGEQDDSIADVLAPTIDQAIASSIDQDPKKLAESLYPIMGPAIRKSISETLQQMLETFNQLLEQSLSPKSLRWRFEAWRTGVSYSQYVLLNTLDYHVEQVFLVHRETSLLLQHVVANNAQAKDPDMVTGMLSAIQDFIEDSFSTSEGDVLDTLRLGELNVLIQRGPLAVLAAVVRGPIPETLRKDMMQTLENLHSEKRQALIDYSGDASEFEALQGDLQTLLERSQKRSQKAKPRKVPWLALLAIITLVSVWAWYAYQQQQIRQGVVEFVAHLDRQPGIVVLTTYHDSNKKLRVSLLADPLAASPQQVQKDYGLIHDIEFQVYSHLSAADSLVQKRAKILLKPSENVALSVVEGVLTVSGQASKNWLEQANLQWPLIIGLSNIDTRALQVLGPKVETINDLRASIEGLRFKFPKGSSELLVNPSNMSKLVAKINTLYELWLSQNNTRLKIDIVGYTDETGSTEYNRRLGLNRALALQTQLEQLGIRPDIIKIYSGLDYNAVAGSNERVIRLIVDSRRGGQ